MKKKRLFGFLLTAVLLIGCMIPSYASTTQEQINAVRSQKKQTESALQSTKNRIAELEAKKNESESYLEELNAQLTELKEELESLQSQYEKKQKELSVIEDELAAANVTERRQREAMKLRIQYMYENSEGTSALETLFSGEDFSDFLSQATTMSELNEYDRELMEQYQKTCSLIEEKEEKAKEEKKEIASLKAQSEEKQAQVQDIYEATYAEVQHYAETIEDEESEEARLVASIQKQEANLNALIIRQREEEQAAARAEAERKAAEAAAQKKAAASSKSGSSQQSGSSSSSSAGTQQSAAAEPAPASSQATQEAASGTSSGKYLGKFKLTAYCPCSKCCGVYAANPGVTASGAMATPGVTVAMGGLPFGTKLSINGHVYTVQDRGTAYGHVDIYFNTHSEALAFGAKHADVYQLN